MTRVPRPDPHVIVVVGATGDLARGKLLPALFHLAADDLLPKAYRIVGVARSPLTDEEFREMAREAIRVPCTCGASEEVWREFAEALSYVAGDLAPGRSDQLGEAVAKAEAELGSEASRLFYLAVPSAAFAPVTLAIGEAGLAERSRIVYEKPFGSDLQSARELNETVHRVFDESQVYRIDHYLGKETVQNILALRFANGMFEPIWNRSFVDHVQIDAPEEVGVEGRAGFYDQTGALRDMLVTHLFQVLTFVAMEPPSSFEPRPLIADKVKALRAIVPLRSEDVVLGRYEGYEELDGVDPAGDTETFVAARVGLDNWRWADVPFYLRTGKRMARKRTAVTIAFSEPPRQLFPHVHADPFPPDHLTLDLGPDEGFSLAFMAKKPGYELELRRATMRFSYGDSFGAPFIQAYERLLLDALLGDRTLFTDAEGTEQAWQAVQPILDRPPPALPYRPGSWGPEEAERLIAPRRWHLPE